MTCSQVWVTVKCFLYVTHTLLSMRLNCSFLAKLHKRHAHNTWSSLCSFQLFRIRLNSMVSLLFGLPAFNEHFDFYLFSFFTSLPLPLSFLFALYLCEIIYNLHVLFLCYLYLCFCFKSIITYIPWILWKYQSIFSASPFHFVLIEYSAVTITDYLWKVICVFSPLVTLKIFLFCLCFRVGMAMPRVQFSWLILHGSKYFLNL